MTNEFKWHTVLSKFSIIALILGLLMLLASMGTLKVGSFEFTPSDGAGLELRFHLASAGLILILLGTTLVLNEQGIWSGKLGAFFFALSLCTLGALGYLNLNQSTAEPSLSYKDLRLFNNWDVSEDRFFSQIATGRLGALGDEKRLSLLCRRHDPTVEFESDVRIVKSARFKIRPEEVVQTLAISFPPEFSSKLVDGDVIECALVALAEGIPLDKIRIAEDVIELGGEILSFASDDVAAPRGDGPPSG
ncbi:MAG: hypothetical protein AAF358_04840 [Pseudomonadota bacterium]